MSNAELSDRMMTLFNEARWDEWHAELSSDATVEDMAMGSKSVGADEVVAYAKNWKTMFPDMIGTCEQRHDAGDVLVEECRGLELILEILRHRMETPSANWQ